MIFSNTVNPVWTKQKSFEKHYNLIFQSLKPSMFFVKYLYPLSKLLLNTEKYISLSLRTLVRIMPAFLSYNSKFVLLKLTSENCLNRKWRNLAQINFQVVSILFESSRLFILLALFLTFLENYFLSEISLEGIGFFDVCCSKHFWWLCFYHSGRFIKRGFVKRENFPEQ